MIVLIEKDQQILHQWCDLCAAAAAVVRLNVYPTDADTSSGSLFAIVALEGGFFYLPFLPSFDVCLGSFVLASVQWSLGKWPTSAVSPPTEKLVAVNMERWWAILTLKLWYDVICLHWCKSHWKGCHYVEQDQCFALNYRFFFSFVPSIVVWLWLSQGRPRSQKLIAWTGGARNNAYARQGGQTCFPQNQYQRCF